MSKTIYHKGVKGLAQRDVIGRLFRMYRNPRRIGLAGLVLLVVGVALLMTIVFVEPSPVGAQTIPSNASGGCPVPAATFNGWFKSGSPSVNGLVDPANSLAFVPSSLCSFYQWSEQMFLWLLSPAPSSYGGGAHIFDSPTFYDVSPLNSSDQRTLTKHVSGLFPIVGVRVPTPGPHGLPVIMDKRHRLFEVEPAKLAPSGKQLILNSAGKEVEVESATIKEGKVVFKEATGKMIASPKPILRPELLDPKAAPRATPQAARKVTEKPAAPQALEPQIVQRFIFNGRPIFINPLGIAVTPVDPEEGQATGDALLSVGKSLAHNSLVYYTIVVNDVYAYFLTGNKTGGIMPAASQFPTTSANLALVTAFASTKGVTFPDPNALTVEVKMSWVDASTLSSPGNYITVSATVPNYDTSNPSQWTPNPMNPTKNVTLALVGVHFVATVIGHPEMIWATFEHFGNTPNAAYTYTSGSGSTTVPQDSAGNWLFCIPNCPTGSTFNSSHASVSGANIVGNPSITPSNTLRTNPWGLPGTAAASVGSNTQIVSINNSVLSQLLSGDMRKNYFMLGATWTIGGAPPSTGTQVGTNLLANSTMETYVQGGSNCFSCHSDRGQANGMLGFGTNSGLSHIYFAIQPLP